MKVLLVGEYSGVHTQLAKSLRKKGIEVLFVSDGDAYKKFPNDINIEYKFYTGKRLLLKRFLNFYYIFLLYSGLQGIIQIFKYISQIRKLKNYDVVQIINPVALSGFGSIVNILFIKYLAKYNKSLFLCALGDDYYWVKGSMLNKRQVSMFSIIKLKYIYEYIHPLMYRYGFLYKFLNNYAISKSKKIIPGLYDYYVYYRNNHKCTDIVPIIVDIKHDVLPFKFEKYPIKIFHGWQPKKEARKGNDLFDEALKRLSEKYPDKIDYEILGGVDYNTYIQSFNKAVIFLDQCYSMDRGVNALLGMANGKVVLSGFVKALEKKYNTQFDPVVVHVNPNVNEIFNMLEELILNPKQLEIISKNSIDFIGRYHSEEFVLKKYFKIWQEK